MWGCSFGPLGLVLFVNVLRQKRCTGLIQSSALIAFLWWQAFGATHGVVRTWALAGRWIVQFFVS
jgi:hypothetical protein